VKPLPGEEHPRLVPRIRPALRALIAALALGAAGAPGALAGDRVFATAEEVEPLTAGSAVPEVAVRTVRGDAVDLAGLVRERGALLVFYRGGW
jgi:hypothetical protein